MPFFPTDDNLWINTDQIATAKLNDEGMTLSMSDGSAIELDAEQAGRISRFFAVSFTKAQSEALDLPAMQDRLLIKLDGNKRRN